MTARPSVTLAQIFSLSREDTNTILSSQGRSPSEGKTALNADHALLAMMYYNFGQIASEEDAKAISNPRFYEVMSKTKSLQQGLDVLYPYPLPHDVVELTLSFLTPEEAYLRNLVEPSTYLTKASLGVNLGQALNMAIERNSVILIAKILDDITLRTNKEKMDYTVVDEILEQALPRVGNVGNLEIAHLFVNTDYRLLWSKSSTEEYEFVLPSDFKHQGDIFSIIEAAARRGHTVLIKALADQLKYFSEDKKQEYRFHWNKAAVNAVAGGHLGLIKWLSEHDQGINKSGFWSDVMHESMLRDRYEIMEYAYPRMDDEYKGLLVGSALNNNSLNSLQWLVEHKERIDVEDIVQSLIEKETDEIQYTEDPSNPVKDLYDYALLHCDNPDWNYIFRTALYSGFAWLAIPVALHHVDVNVDTVEEKLIADLSNYPSEEDRAEDEDNEYNRVSEQLEVVRKIKLARSVNRA